MQPGSSFICENIQEHVTHIGRQQTSVEADHHLASDLPTRYNILISPSWLPYMPCRVVTGLSDYGANGLDAATSVHNVEDGAAGRDLRIFTIPLPETLLLM